MAEKDEAKIKKATQDLRDKLKKFESLGGSKVCDLVEKELLAEQVEERYAHEVIFKDALGRDLIVWMRSGGVKGGTTRGALSFKADSSDAVAQRVRQLGIKLFPFVFLAQDGFLPSKEEDACIWDSGLLDFALLAYIPSTEDSLSLVRRIIMRHLQRDEPASSPTAKADIWALGHWQLCQDVPTIESAFNFLSHCWRGLTMRSPGKPQEADLRDFPRFIRSGDHWQLQDIVFKMFGDLALWRLPNKALLTPWVPGQVLVAHVAVQCKQLEEQWHVLVEETRENLEQIAWLNAVIKELSLRLEAADARSQQCMRKQVDVENSFKQLS